jgi:hypothetical protein
MLPAMRDASAVRPRCVAWKMASHVQRAPVDQRQQVRIGYPSPKVIKCVTKKHKLYTKVTKELRLARMKAKKSTHTRSIRMNEEELAVAEWLAKQTKRTMNNAVNWAVGEVAVKLGYKPKANKK